MGKAMKIDFGGVPQEIRKGGGGGKRIPEGDYLVKVVKAETKTSESKGTKYINWQFQVVKGEHKGVTLYGMTSLKPEALWSLRNLIHAALGKNVAGKSVNFDPEKLYGKIVGATVTDDEYTKDGKTKINSRVNTCFPKDEFEEDSDSDDEEDDDIEEETEEVEDEDDEDDLEEVEVEEL